MFGSPKASGWVSNFNLAGDAPALQQRLTDNRELITKRAARF